MAKKATWLLVIILIAILVTGLLYLSGKPIKNQSAEAKIKENLIGMNLTYSTIAGEPINFTITAEDIKSIEKTTLDNKAAWKVNIGESLA
jgi:hypothetical protein